MGSGQLDLTGYVHGTQDGGVAGVMLDVEKRFSGSVSAFGDAWAGVGYGSDFSLEYGAKAGLRWRF